MKIMKKAIAMRCSQKQFDLIKNELIKSGLKIEQIRDFKTSNFLVNNFAGVENVITNVLYSDAKNHEREIHETFNAKIFLEACGIETDVYEITKEQVRMIEPYYSAVKFWFPEAFKNELEVGKWYKNKYDSLFCVTEKDDEKYRAYGFAQGNWIDLGEFTNNEDLSTDTEATPQEVETALTNEAKKRYRIGDIINPLENYYYVDFKKLTIENLNFISENNNSCVFIEKSNGYNIGVMKNGKWATIIERKKMTISEIENELGYSVEII